MMVYVNEDDKVLMACPDLECESDEDGSFWVELEDDYVDDLLGGHSIKVVPDEAFCPACGRDGIPVAEERP